ncbi:MAG: hypothetical protein J6S28_00155, partial [Clostridia bacterium]|nr:hypothetical protein [Clostridia bacterium]
MKKKRIIIAVVCLILAVLMVCSLFVAAGIAFSRIEDFQFGGLVGELLAGKDEILSDDATADTETDSPEELATDESYTEDFTYEDVTDIMDPPIPGGTPTLRFFLGGCESWIDTWISSRKVQEFFEPGNALKWDHRAVIDDYNVNYVNVWGWAAIFEEAPLQLGYKIDNGPSIYDDSAEFYDAHESSVTAALGIGAVSAIGMRVNIPVEHLSGTHTVEIVVRRLGGNEGTICQFEIQKAEPPYVFMADAAYLADMLEQERSAGIESYRYVEGRHPEKGYVRVSPIADTHFPYVSVCPYNGEVYSTGARYLVIKCRNFGPDNAYVNVSSDEPELEDSLSFTYTGLGWQLIIIDLAQASSVAVNSSYDITT